MIVPCKTNQQHSGGFTLPLRSTGSSRTDRQTGGSALPGARAGESHSSHACTAKTCSVGSQDTMAALEPERCGAAVAHGTSTQLWDQKGTSATSSTMLLFALPGSM